MKWFKSFINSCKKTLTEIKNFFPQEVETIEDFIKNVKEKKCKEVIISSHRSDIFSLIHSDSQFSHVVSQSSFDYQYFLNVAGHPLEGKVILFSPFVCQETWNHNEDERIRQQKTKKVENNIKIAAYKMKEQLTTALPTIKILIDVKLEPEQNILTEAAG